MKQILLIAFILITGVCFGQTSFDKIKKYNAVQAKNDSIAAVANTPVLSRNDLIEFAKFLEWYNPDKARNRVIIAELERILFEAQQRKTKK